MPCLPGLPFRCGGRETVPQDRPHAQELTGAGCRDDQKGRRLRYGGWFTPLYPCQIGAVSTQCSMPRFLSSSDFLFEHASHRNSGAGSFDLS